MEYDYEALKLENQLCFPLYCASKEVINRYRPYLDELSLTYTQYIVMLDLWAKKRTCVKDLGADLCLDSGTLTPVLKTLENKGYVVRKRDEVDERVLVVTLTKEGQNLEERAKDIPVKIREGLNLTDEEAATLRALLYKTMQKKED